METNEQDTHPVTVYRIPEVKWTLQLDKVRAMLESAASEKIYEGVKKKHFLLCWSAVYKILMEERREKNCIKNFVRYWFDKKLIRSILNKKPLWKKQSYKVIESQKTYYEDDNW